MTGVRLLLTGGVVLALSGCMFIGSDGPEYTRAQVAPPLKVPDDLDDEAIVDRLAIPPISASSGDIVGDASRTPRPVVLHGRAAEDRVKIQRLGERAWLVVNDPPAAVWPRLKQYLADSGVPVDREQPEAGIIETVWFKVDGRARDGLRAALDEIYPPGHFVRVRLTVEQGLRRGTAEVHITTQAAATADIARNMRSWPPGTGTDADMQAALADVGGYLASELGGSGVSLLAQNISAAEKAALRRDDNGAPYLYLRLDFNRAWATVGQALANAEINVTDIDRDASVFFVDVSDDELARDRSSRLASWLRLGGDGSHKLEVHLAERDAGYVVAVTGADAQPVDDHVAEQMLSLIRDHAS